MKKVLSGVISAGLIAPLLSFAQIPQYNPSQGINGFFVLAKSILAYVLPLLISVAVLYFIYNVFQYTIKSGDEEARKKAKGNIIWGVVGLFVIVGVWGLVAILQSAFGIDGSYVAPNPSGIILQ